MASVLDVSFAYLIYIFDAKNAHKFTSGARRFVENETPQNNRNLTPFKEYKIFTFIHKTMSAKKLADNYTNNLFIIMSTIMIYQKIIL